MKNFTYYSFIAMIFALVILSCSSGEEAALISNADANTFEQKNGSIEITVGSYDAAGNITMTGDTLKLKRMFENDLRKNGINTPLHKIELLKSTIGGTAQEYYYLKASSQDGSVKIATQAIPKPAMQFLIVLARSHDFLKSTCTCRGCNKGCNPSYSENPTSHMFEWECSDCQTENNNCEKTVTAVP